MLTRRKKRKIILENEVSSDEEKVSSYEKEEVSSDEEEEFLTNKEQLELLKKTDREAYMGFINVKKEIERTNPKLIKILKSPMSLEDRVNLFQLYEIYVNIPPNTEEWLLMRNKINSLYKEYTNNYKYILKYSKNKTLNNMNEEYDNYDSKITLKYKILNLNAPKEVIYTIYKKFEEFEKMDTSNDEYNKLKLWLKWSVNIPHNNIKEVRYTKKGLTSFLLNVSKELDKKLYGMRDVKEQILLFLNCKILNPNMKRCNLGLVGKPGTGKTAIARLLSSIIDFPFEQISFGGISNTDFLKGHDYTYVGSQPGEIVKCLSRMKYKNGILYLDEFEKIGDNPTLKAFLLHITDPGQNNEYRDNYLSQIPIDLSNIWFIYSMNNLPTESALRDRIFTIKLKGYSHEDKIQILENYLLPKALINLKLKKKSIKFADNSANFFISRCSNINNVGIRNIENVLNNMLNKLVFIINHQDKNGLLKNFNLTFDIKKKLKFPIVINNSIIEKLYTQEQINSSIASLYI